MNFFKFTCCQEPSLPPLPPKKSFAVSRQASMKSNYSKPSLQTQPSQFFSESSEISHLNESFVEDIDLTRVLLDKITAEIEQVECSDLDLSLEIMNHENHQLKKEFDLQKGSQRLVKVKKLGPARID